MSFVHPEFVYCQSDLAYDTLLKDLRSLGLEDKPEALRASAEGLRQAAARLEAEASNFEKGETE